MLALTDVKPGCECMVKWFFADRDIEENMRCLGIGQGSRLQVVSRSRGHLIIAPENGRRIALSEDIAKRIKV